MEERGDSRGDAAGTGGKGLLENEACRLAVDALDEAVLLIDRDGKILGANPSASRILGQPFASIFSPPWKAFAEDGSPVAPSEYPSVVAVQTGRTSSPRRLRIERADGSSRWIQVRSIPVRPSKEGESEGALSIFSDVTDDKGREDELRRTNRALQFRSAANAALVRALDEGSLLHELCRVAVEKGGFRLAWVGLAQDGPDKAIQPVARAGHDDGYVESIAATWSDTERGQGPSGRAVREGEHQICRSTDRDPSFSTWRAAALARGILSTIALPIQFGGQRRGVFTLYSGREDSFDATEVALLEGLAADISYGLAACAERWARWVAEDALRHSEQRVSEQLRLQVVAARIGLVGLGDTDRAGLAAEAARSVAAALEVARCRIYEVGADASVTLVAAHEPGPRAALEPLSPAEAAWVLERLAGAANEPIGLAGAPGSLAGEPPLGPGVLVPIHGQGRPFGALALYPAVGRALADDALSFARNVGSTVGTAFRAKAASAALADSNRRLEEALETLQQAQDQLLQQERLRALGTLASGIAHDFNNHLMPIMGFSELLLDLSEARSDPVTLERYLRLIHEAAKGAGQVVSRLREFYRKREDRDPLAPTDLSSLVESAVSLTQPRWRDEAQSLGRTIVIDLDLEACGLVMGNADELRSALVNLILNAVDALPRGGRIGLSTHDVKGQVVVEVRDDGVGMSQEVRRRCLEPFFTTKGKRGTGLGLPMVWGTVERHQGTIDLDSGEGKGTLVTIRLPAVAEPAAPTPAPPGRAIEPRRILLVDDEPTSREVLAAYFENDGHEVEVVLDGRAALERLSAREFDLLVTDRSMPGMSGDQLAAEVRASWPRLPIIMVTGFGELIGATSEQIPGVDLVLPKPLMLHQVREALVGLAREGRFAVSPGGATPP